MKNKKFFVFAVLTFATLGGLTVFTQVNKTNAFVNAEECDHHHVEHYVGHANQDFAGTGGGYVDHYACCGCHTVWADEARTIVLGQSTADRAKIDLRNITSYKFQWDWTGVPHYSEEHGVVYESILLNAPYFTNHNGSFYIETVSDFIDEEVYSTVTFEFTNNTKFNLDIRVEKIDTGTLFVRKTVASGETTTFSLTSEQYNTPSSNPDDGTKNGFNLWFTGTDATTISSSDKVSISVPKFNSQTDPVPFTNNVTGQNYPTAGSWGPIPHEKGVYSLKASYGWQYFDPRTSIPDWATLYLNFVNPTDTDATVYFDYILAKTVTVPAHGNATVGIPASVWNAPVNPDTDSDKIRFTISGAEDLKLSMHYKLDTSEQDFLAELDAITLSDIVANGSYHADFMTKLKPVLDRINAHYGNAVPAAIKNHRNYVDYAAASTFTKWDYGTSTVSTTTVDGVEYVKVTVNANGEESIITRAFANTSGANKFVVRIYNPKTTDMQIWVGAGYNEGWEVGGKFTLPAQKWTTLAFDKTKFNHNNEFNINFQACEVGNEILVSPVVDYKVASELQGTVVWSGVVTEKAYGWAAMPSTPTKYGDAYTSQNTNSAIEDPDWKSTCFFLNNTATVDAETYSYVKFYAYNLTDHPLFVALRGVSGQYHFDESGNSLGQKEWKAFLIPVEKWNDNDGKLELLFNSYSSGEDHTGTIMVTRFVGVAK